MGETEAAKTAEFVINARSPLYHGESFKRYYDLYSPDEDFKNTWGKEGDRFKIDTPEITTRQIHATNPLLIPGTGATISKRRLLYKFNQHLNNEGIENATVAITSTRQGMRESDISGMYKKLENYMESKGWDVNSGDGRTVNLSKRYS